MRSLPLVYHLEIFSLEATDFEPLCEHEDGFNSDQSR